VKSKSFYRPQKKAQNRKRKKGHSAPCASVDVLKDCNSKINAYICCSGLSNHIGGKCL